MTTEHDPALVNKIYLIYDRAYWDNANTKRSVRKSLVAVLDALAAEGRLREPVNRTPLTPEQFDEIKQAVETGDVLTPSGILVELENPEDRWIRDSRAEFALRDQIIAALDEVHALGEYGSGEEADSVMNVLGNHPRCDCVPVEVSDG